MKVYLTVNEVIEIHRNLIEEFGGSHGIRDVKLLESAIMRPQIGYYKNIIEEAAAFMESLSKNHCFVDGNKRISFFATDIFLRLNNHYFECDNEQAHKFLIGLFNKNIFNYDHLLSWLQKIVKSK